ncbi:hypothetical protein J2046_000492 [Rhizobium petrolearium]|uniref:hypothetical protein n=1 Tax=Neorhizobium petrolearium TaxID=515361 RepID=UPI001AEA2E5D|nr:hypothetical protein [Neorhizobium petrolearium]MBP1842248.1 hypothetical protein [Neorhizobium petrolearium]
MKRLGWCAALINKSGRIANTDFEKIERQNGLSKPDFAGHQKDEDRRLCDSQQKAVGESASCCYLCANETIRRQRHTFLRLCAARWT